MLRSEGNQELCIRRLWSIFSNRTAMTATQPGGLTTNFSGRVFYTHPGE